MDFRQPVRNAAGIVLCAFCGILLFLAILFVVSIFSGCTYNVSMAHTEGTASDVIDDTQAPENTVSPNLTIPLK